MASILAALYENMDVAQEVVRDLQTHSFDPEHISLVAQNMGELSALPMSEQRLVLSPASGRDFGAMVGGLTGLLAGLVTITVPGIGPIIAAGPLAAVLGGATGSVIGAGAGAVTGGLSASLVKLEIPEERARRFEEGLLQGNVLVTADVSNNTVDQAIRIMSHYLPIDIQYHDDRNWPDSGGSEAPIATDHPNGAGAQTGDVIGDSDDPDQTKPRRPRAIG